MRCFFAISVPAAVGEKLLGLVPPIRGVRRSRADKLHLTLHFLSEAPDTLATDVVLADLPPRFRITPGKLILLPERGPIRVIAASITSGGDSIRTIHGKIATELQHRGLAVESRPHLPHITLARCEPALPQQVRGQTPMTPREDVSFDVAEVVLIESTPTDRGFDYAVRRSWPLPA